MMRCTLLVTILTGVVAMAGLPGGWAYAAATEPGSRAHLVTEDVRLEADGRSVTTTHVELIATNDATAMKMGQIGLNYDAALSTLDVVEAYTLKKDGTRIPVEPSAIYDQAAPGAAQSPMFTEFHVRTIVFPQFAAGDTAVYTVRLTTKEAMLPGQFWSGDSFSRQFAFDEVRETIDAPDSLKLYVESHDVDFSKRHENGRTIYSWHYSAPNPLPPKNLAISALDRTPRYFISTFADYGALGQAYAKAAAPQAALTPQIQALADQLTKGIADRRDQAKALYEWVGSHIRYVAVELGRGSMVPHAAQDVLSNGYGDCKDHVTLLAALLKAKGIDSEGVLINAGNAYTLSEVPTFTGLDHIITYLPEFRLYLDSTAAVAPFGVLPFNEYGKPVVFAALNGARRDTMPVLPPGLATAHTVTQTTLDQDGRITGTTVTTATGPYQIILRGIELAAQALGPDVAAQKQMESLGYQGHPGGSISAPPPLQLGDSYTLTAQFNAGGLDDEVAGKMRFVVPGGLRVLGVSGAGMMGIFGDSPLADDADYPCYSALESEDISLTAPAGRTFDRVPHDKDIKTDYLRFHAHWSLAGRTMTVHRDFVSHIDQPLCTADVRKANKAALKAISDVYDTQLLLVPDGGGDAKGQSAQTGVSAFGQDASFPAKQAQFVALFNDASAAMSRHDDNAALAIVNNILAMKDLPVGASHMALCFHAHLYDLMAEYDKGLADTDRELNASPHDGFCRLTQAGIYLHLRERNKAMADLDAALLAHPAAFIVHQARADLLLREGRYGDAIADYSAVLEDSPSWHDGYILRAVAEELNGDDKAAKADIQQAVNGGVADAAAKFHEALAEVHLHAPAPLSNADTPFPYKSSPPGTPPPESVGVHTGGAYPVLSELMGDEGRVYVALQIGADGRVTNVQLARSSGFDDLDLDAMMAAKAWHYRAAMRDGKPFASPLIVRLTYVLHDDDGPVAVQKAAQTNATKAGN